MRRLFAPWINEDKHLKQCQLPADVQSIILTGISKNSKNKKRLNRTNRQKVSQWSFYQQRQYLKYKCAEIGIETDLEPEYGTSKTCPKCGYKGKPNGRNYNCPTCNLKMHRDVVGACNIRTKHLTGVLNGNDNFNRPTVKYLRIDPEKSGLKSSSGAGVARRKRHKPYRCRLGVPKQLTLFPSPTGGAIQSGM
jgi:IS605 OrfB family transposase